MPDKAVGEITKDWEGGYVRVRLFVGKYGDSEDTVDSCGWRSNEKPPQGQPKKLLCNLYQCKNLPAADSDAFSDPYVKFYCGGQEVQTGPKEKENSLNPMWYRSIPMDLYAQDISDAPPMIIYVMDHDTIDDDDLLGM
jgi:hypothetical protein